MLRGLRLGNFKAFAESQYLPIRPLTIIFGQNSAGKSSLIHGLLMAHEAHKTGSLDIFRPNISGDSVDLGGFRQYVHRHLTTNQVEWTAQFDASSFPLRMSELLGPARSLDVTLRIGLKHVERKLVRSVTDDRTGEEIDAEFPTGEMIPIGEPNIDTYEISADGKPLIRFSRRPDGLLGMVPPQLDHPVIEWIIKNIVEANTTTEFHSSDNQAVEQIMEKGLSENLLIINGLVPKGIQRFLQASTEKPSAGFFPVSKGNRSDELFNVITLFLPYSFHEIVKGVYEIVSTELGRLKYLGPLRSYPPRHLAFAEYHDTNWIAGGGYAWDRVRKNELLREKLNSWLGSNLLQSPYALVVRNLTALSDVDALIEAITSEGEIDESSVEEASVTNGKEIAPSLLRDFRDRSSMLNTIPELVLIDRRNNTVVSHRDVGIGISQVLPVLVGAYAEKNAIMAIEQPEIHLHPGLQAQLGDVFVESAIGESKNTFIIETHSEHLMLRVMRRIRETHRGLRKDMIPITPEDVSVLYVERDGSRSIVREMPLNEDGELVKAWPGGFFEEGLQELFP